MPRMLRLIALHHGRNWHIASIRGNAAIQSLLERSGHSASRAYRTGFMSTRPKPISALHEEYGDRRRFAGVCCFRRRRLFARRPPLARALSKRETPARSRFRGIGHRVECVGISAGFTGVRCFMSLTGNVETYGRAAHSQQTDRACDFTSAFHSHLPSGSSSMSRGRGSVLLVVP